MKDNRRGRRDSDSLTANEIPDFLFKYSDSDGLNEELAEWYTYSEEPEFVWNVKAFKETLFQSNYVDKKWSELSKQDKRIHLNRLLDQLDINNKQTRDNVCRSILYIAQGNFQECETINEFNKNLVENVELLYETDTFSIFTELLLFEVNNISETFLIEAKYAPCISDNVDIRVILSVLYTMLEVIRLYDQETNAGRFMFDKETNVKYAGMKSLFRTELNKPMAKTNELFSVYLFQLINKFCNQNIIVLPIKKIILILWKVLLFTMGGLEEAFRLKNEQRLKFNLPIITENPSEIINKMSPATPPPNPIDLVNEFQFSNPTASYNKRKKNSLDTVGLMNGLTKQTKGIDNDDMTIINNLKPGDQSGSYNSESISDASNDMAESDSVLLLSQSNEIVKTIENGQSVENQELELTTSNMSDMAINVKIVDADSDTPYPTSASPPPETSGDETKSNEINNENKKNDQHLAAASDAIILKLQFYNQTKILPWKPKVRLIELQSFLDQERKKFLGYGDLNEDLETLIGLPYPIHESVKILKQHLFLSLSDEQIKLEEKIIKYPLSTKNLNQKSSEKNSQDDEDLSNESPAELLFESLLNNLPQYLICLLKILLTSVPQTRPKTDSLQIMSDLFPEDLLGSHFLTIKLGIDTNRHKEILIKAISAIILLMLKHFKVNHVYQFEFMSQHLLFANCVPLILKFFNLNISSFIQSKNSNIHLDFPNCLIGKQPEIDAEELENGDSSVFRWRNVFSCINLLRILNKLTKYKRSRVMMLVIFKSAPILKKILRVKQTMLQLYALKLLKMQTRHLGRQWRKTNMSTMSAIYQKVRHRLNDDWAFGNEQEAQAWDFQSDECALRTKIDKYIQRCFKSNELEANTGANQFNQTQIVETQNNFDYLPTDNNILSCLNKKVELPENFEENYEQWLKEEVYSNKINWDKLMNSSTNCPIVLY